MRRVRYCWWVLGVISFARFAAAQTVDPSLWVPNGAVSTVVRAGGTIYIGGDFTEVGPATGGGVPLDSTTGLPPPSYPKVSGIVRVVVPDGGGGWYIGGSFSHVGGVPRSNAAHIRANGSVAPWNPNVSGQYGHVSALAIRQGVVFVGGSFNAIGGQLRNNIAAVDTAAGLATGWNPNANYVLAMALNDTVLYVGGGFTSIGGQGRNHIAAISANTGLAMSWNPGANADVYALAYSGSTVYAGGAFDFIGGRSLNHLAALSISSDSARTWNPGLNSGGYVYSIALRGGRIFAGGDFSTVFATPRHSIASYDSASGVVTGWNPDANGGVRSLILNGRFVYAGGGFTTIGGQTRHYLAAVDTGNAQPTGWNPRPAVPSGAFVRALAANGTTVYAGGEISTLAGVARNNIAALDAVTGVATVWNPNANSGVRALVVSDTTLYVGGWFSAIGGVGRLRLAALNLTTGIPTAWNPGADDKVTDIAIGGTNLYVGGRFGTLGGVPRRYAGAVKIGTDSVTAWNPNANSIVSRILVAPNAVYVGGSFDSVSNQPHRYLVAVDPVSGAPTAWNPNPNGAVTALALQGSSLFAGGDFTLIGGQPQSSYCTAVDTTTGLATGWSSSADNPVRSLLARGTTIYMGGAFYTAGGASRNFLAALDATDTALGWDPSIAPFDHFTRVWPSGPSRPFSVLGLATSGSTLYVAGDFLGVGGTAQSYIAAISGALTVTAVAPASGGNGGATTLTIQGMGFQSGATVRLSRVFPPADIFGTSVTVSPDGSSLSATFDLTGAAAGPRLVTVTNPSVQSATLANGFTVTTISPPSLEITLLGPSQVRADRRTAYDLVIQNPGNVDAVDVPLWLTGVPLDDTLEVDFPLAYPPQIGGEPPWGSSVPLTFTGAGTKYLPLVIPRVPPGTTVRRVYLTAHVTSGYKLRAAVTPPWVDGNVFRSCLANGGITNPPCMGSQLTTINAYMAANPSIQAMSGTAVWTKVVWQCEGPGTLPVALIKAEQVLDYMVGPVESPATAISACSNVLPPRSRDSLVVTIVGAIDPNDKLGPGDSVSVRQTIPYTIRFQNAANATAPAQNVTITDPIDITTLDPETVSLGDITFGSFKIIPPPGLKSLPATVDMRPTRNIIVHVNVGIDPISKALGWSFVSTDPSGQPPPVNDGFLPPNTEGSVLFTIMPKPSLPAGTVIHNHATIQFDTNAPVTTNDWTNGVDVTAPTSHVMPLAAHSDYASFQVAWTADGSPSDLKDFTVLVSEDGGPYRVWRQDVATLGDTLVPPGNHLPHSYSFYSRARDRADNQELVPASADATTQSRVAVEGAAPLELALEGAQPNPAVHGLSIAFTLPSRAAATLDLIDVAGRRVLRREVGGLGPGRHVVALDAAPFRPGIYFIRLAQSGRTLNARAAIIR